MNLKPINKNILLEEIGGEEKTSAGGIVLIEKKLKTTREGKVLATDSTLVAVGNKVIFSVYGPQEIMWEGRKYYIVKEVDLLVIVE